MRHNNLIDELKEVSFRISKMSSIHTSDRKSNLKTRYGFTRNLISLRKNNKLLTKTKSASSIF